MCLFRPGIWQRIAITALLFLFAHGASFNSWATSAEESAEATKRASVSVVLDGRELFSVIGVAAYPAEVRAKAFVERIRALADDPSFTIDQLRIEEGQNETVILAGDRRVIYLVNADAKMEDIERPLLAKAVKSAVAEAVTQYRKERSQNYLLRSLAIALGMMTATALLLLIFRQMKRWLLHMIQTHQRAKLEELGSKAYGVIGAQQFEAALKSLISSLWWLLVMVTLLVCFAAVMEMFPWTRQIARWEFELFLNPLKEMWRAVSTAFPDLIFLAILYFVVRYLLRLLYLFFFGVARGTIRLSAFDTDWAIPTFNLLRVGILAFSIVIAYPYIPGSGSEAFKGISLFIGVLFSIGSTSMITSMLAGYNLIYRRIYKVGDYVKIGSHTGLVKEVGQMVTRLHTFKNEEVVLPNSMILSSEVLNYSSSARAGTLVLHSTITIGYDAPWRQVEAMLIEAAKRTEGLLKEPKPFVLKKTLGDFYIEYEINAYCGDASRMPQLYSQLHAHIADVFNEYGVQIMSPHFVSQPDVNIFVPQDKWFAAPAERPKDIDLPGT
ncbi:mechanosensitive ion channel protein MscS [Parazoarcus communis]|uniref:Small-conductance mechanosensitive channel n=1 Tax=Parazoarcus communis TaxID=41977 RepID=A0A2U8H0K4_9RHOO|nr:mechanosensitive ion channel domain-containing protein [Parazoarcus communis]AWI79150.1 mechanosensitive ion channel protein MscS [Parazoarcus communis]